MHYSCMWSRGASWGLWKMEINDMNNTWLDGVPGMPAGAVRTLTGRLACRCQNTSLSWVTKWRLSSSSSCRYFFSSEHLVSAISAAVSMSHGTFVHVLQLISDDDDRNINNSVTYLVDFYASCKHNYILVLNNVRYTITTVLTIVTKTKIKLWSLMQNCYRMTLWNGVQTLMTWQRQRWSEWWCTKNWTSTGTERTGKQKSECK